MFSYLLAAGGKNFASSFAAAASREAEATGGGIQIILPPIYLLMMAASDFHLRLAVASKTKKFCLKKKKFCRRPPIGRRKPLEAVLQIILPIKYLLMTAARGFHHPIGGGLQNILPPIKILAAADNWEAEATGGETRTFCRLKNLWEAAENGFCLPKKLAFRQNVTLPPGGIINSVLYYRIFNVSSIDNAPCIESIQVDSTLHVKLHHKGCQMSSPKVV